MKRCLSIIVTVLLCLNLVIPSYASNMSTNEIPTDSNDADSAINSSTKTTRLETMETDTAETEAMETDTAETTQTDSTEQSDSDSAISEESLDISSQWDVSTPYSTDENSGSILSGQSPDTLAQQAETIFQAVSSAMPSTYSTTSQDVFNRQLEMLIYINMIRQSAGIDVLALCPDISDAAMTRASECQIAFNSDHSRPDGRACFTVLDDMNIPYMTAGENIAKGQPDVLTVMNAWYNSPGHRNNMLTSYFQTVGVGMDFSTSTPTWTQLFTGGYEISSAYIYNLQDTYHVGDSLQEQGIVIYITYTNGLEGIVPVLDSMISGYDANKTGTQTIRVQCQGMYSDFQINVTDPIKDFVSRLYTEVLGRSADASGLNAWSEVLRSGKEQGAKVAQGFIESEEFKSRNLTDKEYITVLYHTFLNREPDNSGMNSWLSILDSGLSRLHVFKGFAESDEFTKICNEYGIIRGNATLTAPMDQNEGVTKFIARCYKLCLGRKADESGLNAWCNQILTGANTAKQAAYGFVFSDEFKKKNLSDTEFVKTMYRVFMDREADSAGLNAWVNVLKNGQSREHVFNGFADSNEFRKICNSYGIK